jgi:hypothetical protein
MTALGYAAGGYVMWDIVAELSGRWLAGEIGKLTPFEGQCGPECFARAEAAYALKEPYTPPADPGPPPEPPAAPAKSSFSSAILPGTILGAAVVAGTAVGLSGSGEKKESGSQCLDSSRCCTTQNGIQTTGFPVPEKTCNCPAGTTQVGRDTVTPGGPYRICDCNGC